MSITHIEELEPYEFIQTLRTIRDYRITEKVDGSQILFGIDDKGFYTSRETKGGCRIYSVDEYDNTFANRYKRSAHILLERVLPALRDAGLSPGDQVEAEVLYGAVPNVVPYSADINYLIFLRTTEGNVNIDNLKQKLDGLSLSVTLLSPSTSNGIDIEFKTETNLWQIDSVPEILYDSHSLQEELIRHSYDLEYWFRQPSKLPSGGTQYDVYSTKLNKIPAWFDRDKYTWSLALSSIENLRCGLRIAYAYRADLIKRIMLEALVFNRPSRFGPDDGWIEGIVLHNPATGHTIKLVDKDTFGVRRKSVWKLRSHLSKSFKKSLPTREELLAELDKYKNGIIHQRDLEAFADLFRKI